MNFKMFQYLRSIIKGSKKLNLSLACLLALSFVLISCSGNTSTDTKASSSTTTNSSTTKNVGSPNSSANSSTAESNQVAGIYDASKTFIFGMEQEPVGFNQVGFDPANLTDRGSLMVTRQIYEGLFESIKADSMGYQWSSFIRNVTISPDGREYKIRLRKGIIFSDGTPLNAEAIKFNFDRWSDKGNIYHTGDFETWQAFWGGFPGNLNSVEVIDSINLTITTKIPMADFFQILAMPQFAIVAPSAFTSNGRFNRPIGSGPYYLSQTIREQPRSLILKPNPNFIIERQDVNNLPELDPIVVQVLRANQDGLKELKDGHISATDKIRPEQTLQNDPSFQILYRTPLDVSFLTMNQSKAPFDNADVRKAFASAINTTTLNNTAFLNLGQPANGPLPPAAFGFRPSQPAYPYNPAMARKLLSQAGYANGLTVDLWRLPDPRPYYADTQKVADAIQHDLAQVGVTVRIQNTDWATFYQDRDDGNLPFFMGGWQGVNGDPNEFFQAIFYKSQRANGYLNPILARLIDQGATSVAQIDRRDIYRQAMDVVYQDVPIIPLAFVKEPIAVSTKIDGYVPSPSGIDKWLNVKFKKATN